MSGKRIVHKYGYNADVDAGEDIWDGGGTYTWPTAAAATTIVSTDAADDADEGTGARTVAVEGLDSNYRITKETATLNGTGAVTLANEYLRVYRARVIESGSGGLNAGAVQIKHGATVLAQISIGYNQTLMSLYTVPVDYSYPRLAKWYATIGRDKVSFATMALLMRPFGESWQTKEIVDLASGGGDFSYEYPVWLGLKPKTDILVRCNAVSTTGVRIAAGFDVILY